MAGYKETPRQKMIGMMYLVLTALLALNVSVELLNAFLIVNESMETTNKNFDAKANSIYTSFERAYAQNPNKVGPFWEKAKQARLLSEDLKNFILQTKWDVLAFSDKISAEEAKQKNLRDFSTKDKYDDATVFFMGHSVQGTGGRAQELKDKIEKYKQELIKLVDPKYQSSIKLGLETNGDYKDANGNKLNWQQQNFYHTILAADVVILNKLMAEVTNAELDVVNILQSSISAEDFKFDEVAAAVVPKSQYIFLGDNYEAEVFVTALDTKQNFTATIGGRSVSSELGKAKITIPGTSEGPKSYTGNVSVKSPSGELKSYPISIEYIVAPPTLSISPTKMNVFYIGVENPVSISAGGVSDAQISASISQGTISREGKGWVARVTQPGKAVVTVSASVGGKVKPMGSFEFRTKSVPSPIATIAGTESGSVGRDMVVAAGALIPKMPPDFDFDLNFVITGFQFSGNRKGDIIDYKGSGNRLTDPMKEFIRGCRRGEKVILEEIYAKGPDGKSRKLNPIVLTIQ